VSLEGLRRIDRHPGDSLAAAVARELLHYVLFTDNVHVGDLLPSERQLVEALGVGRSAVREAIQSLNVLGILETHPGRGTRIRGLESSLLPEVLEWGLLLGENHTHELVEARVHVEVLMAHLAAQRRKDEDLAELKRLLAIMRDSLDDAAAFTKADVEFHLCLAESAKVTVLSDFLRRIQSLLHVWIFENVAREVQETGQPRDAYDEHVPILEAVERGDPEAASAAMTRHMEAARGRLQRILDEYHSGTGDARRSGSRRDPGHQAATRTREAAAGWHRSGSSTRGGLSSS
jgi:GntR family transcriptional regulator, transcriptional repressor for pyruvate dehydrogenase complex